MRFFRIISEYIELARLQKEMAVFFPSFDEQKQWLKRLKTIDRHVTCAHNPSHVLRFLLAVLKLPPGMEGCIVEAGAYKGGGTSKISILAKHAKRKLFVFDSFCGLPDNNEPHEKSTLGHSIEGWFQGGSFNGSLAEVKSNVENYGAIEVCEFIQGWFEDTMPKFKEPIALAYLDVDLASSTRTCLKHLFPLLQPGGAIFSQDGDFPLVIDVFRNESFWKTEVGCNQMPIIEGLGEKITIIRKQ